MSRCVDRHRSFYVYYKTENWHFVSAHEQTCCILVEPNRVLHAFVDEVGEPRSSLESHGGVVPEVSCACTTILERIG
jgi:hypothetical protein